MQTLLRSLPLALAVAGLVLFAPDPAHAQADTTTAWTTTETFEGTGRAETKPFTVEAPMWRIKWTSTSDIPGGMGHVVQIYVLRPDRNKPRRVAANATNQKTLSGTSRTFSSGRYALKIHGLNGDWAVKVQVPK
jgi:hypothetical protein